MIATRTSRIESGDKAHPRSGFLPARDNPFCFSRVSRIGFRFAQHDWPTQLTRLQALGNRAAIVGLQGSGKTTLLYELANRLEQLKIAHCHLFLPQETVDHGLMIRHAVAKSKTGAVILVDGIERLSFVRRQRLLSQSKREGGLVAAVHRPCRLPTWIHCRTNPDLMRMILFDLGMTDNRVLSAGSQAFKNANGNIREALRELYDQFASGRFNDILSR